MNKKNIIILGTGGHSTSITDLILSTKKYKILGFLCSKRKEGDNFLNYKVLGSERYLKKLNKNTLVVLGFSFYKSPKKYKEKYLEIKKMGFEIPTIVSPFSYVSKNSVIGKGVNIFHGVVINNNSKIGNAVTVNSKTLIEHDCQIGDFSHISTGCILNGSVKVAKETFIGSGTIVRENIRINKKKFIKMASTLSKDT